MKELYNGIFQSLNIGKLSKNMKIKNVYSLINGLIFIICFAYNLLYRNLFLILTIPLGIFGIVNVLTYFDKRIFSGKRRNNVDFEKLEKERLNLKIEIKKTDDSIFFHTNEKITSLSKIPESFKENLTDLINDNEEDKAKLIFDSFCENNYVILSALLDEYTNLKIEDINNAISNYLRSDIKLNNKSNILYIKKIKPFNYVLMILLIIISIISVFLMIKNNYLYHIKPLVSAILLGLLKTIIYSDYIEEKISIMKIFFKITKTSLFSSSLIYDIIYMSNVNNGNTKYMLLVIPFTFLFLFSGFNMIISYMKYNKLLKKIRKY